MKKIYLIILTLFFSHLIHAQIFKKLADKVQSSTERAFENKVDREIDKTTESVVDTLFAAPRKISNNRSEKESSSNSSLEMLNAMGNASYESEYIFPVTATIEVEDVNADIKKITMKQGYGKEILITEMEKDSNPIIIDMKNESAIILDINGGKAQVMSLKWMEKIMRNQSISYKEEKEFVTSVKKTGQTKVMNGYTCHEYNITYEGGKINSWYAPDVKFEYQNYLKSMSKLFSKEKEENPMQLLNTDYGYVMEMTHYNKNNEKQNTIKVIGLLEKVRKISMNLFEIQKL